jgi:hypothetical protein
MNPYRSILAAAVFGGVCLGLWTLLAFGPLGQEHWFLRFVALPLFLAALWATPPKVKRDSGEIG